MKHKHYETIVAWAEGKQIQVKHYNSRESEWVDTGMPVWSIQCDYRVKPEPKPDVVRFVCIALFLSGAEMSSSIPCPRPTDNVKLTFDGETGLLKAVEFLGSKN